MVVKSIRWWKVWWEEFKQIFWGKIRDNPKRGKLNQLLWLCYPENASFAANSKCCWDKKKFFINFVGWQKFGSQIDYEVELAKVKWKQKPDLIEFVVLVKVGSSFLFQEFESSQSVINSY